MADQKPHLGTALSRYHNLQQAAQALEELPIQLHLPLLLTLSLPTRCPPPPPTFRVSQTRRLLLIDGVPYPVDQGYKESEVDGSRYGFTVFEVPSGELLEYGLNGAVAQEFGLGGHDGRCDARLCRRVKCLRGDDVRLLSVFSLGHVRDGQFESLVLYWGVGI